MKRIIGLLMLPLAMATFIAQAQTYSRTDIVQYHDDLDDWVIGQPKSSTNFDTGLVESRTDYDADTGLPTKSYAFGRTIRSMSYNADGTLATLKDGNENTTVFSGWKRGIPQTIRFPSTPEAPTGATVSAVVDDNGWIESVADENGFVIGYDYDGMGRLKTIDYPAGDTPDWPNTTIDFSPYTQGAEYGIPAGHWKQSLTTGNAKKVVYFDALWRPLVEETYDAGNAAATRSVTAKRYDIGGRLAFQSYPRVSLGSYADSGLTGVVTTYDALDRLKTTQQFSEIGTLTTTTNYLDGRKISVTNPRNKTTTTVYKAYDQPSADWPLAITHPEAAFTDIVRDVFGKPTSITRRNATASVSSTRQYAYNSQQMLCQTTEPETGVTAMQYDDAGNLLWSAAGLPAPPGGPCTYASTDTAVAESRADRSYDGRNRLATLSFPDHNGDQQWTYAKDGLPAQVTTLNENGTSSVVNTYSYNRRRLLVGETQQQTGMPVWSLGYGYSPQAALSTLTYPSGLSLAYAPNALGQATRAGSFATGVSYYPNGAIAGFTYGNGIVHTMVQNDRQLPERSTDSGVLDDSYDYDQNGNVAAISDGLPGNGGDRSMTYDDLDRLETADAPIMFGGTAAYAYDALDNLTRVQFPGRDHFYCYDQTWRLTNVKTGSCSGTTVIGLGYDPRGNLANKNGVSFQFDRSNRLRNVPGKESYRYDAHGRRVSATSPTLGAIYSFYGQDGVLRYQRDERKAEAYDYITLNGSLVARVTDEAVIVGTPIITAPDSSSDGNYTVQWTPVTLATLYELQERVDGGAWQATYSGSGTSRAMSGKSAGNYAYQVRACRDAVCGSFSPPKTVAVNAPPATAPSLTAPASAPNGDYTLNWSAVPGAESYILEESSGGTWSIAYDGTLFSRVYDGKPAGTYSYRVKGCNPNGCGAYSATKTVQAFYAPSAPTINVPATSNNGSYTVSWSSVPGAAVYKLEERVGSGAWTALPDSTAASKAFSGKADGSYSYRVRACNDAGCSAYSAIDTITVLTPPTAVSTITTPSISATGTYTVTWTAVAKATSYTLQRSTNGGAWSNVYTGATRSFPVSSQGQGSYAYRVQGCNTAGCGGWSDTKTTVVQFVPAAPTSLGGFVEKEMLPGGPKCAIYLNWGSSAGADRYVLKDQSATLYDGPNRNYQKLNVACAAYQTWVQACNAAGCSAWFGPYNVPTQVVGGGGA